MAKPKHPNVPALEIQDVKPGDFVKTGPNSYQKITQVNFQDRKNWAKGWTVSTSQGEVGMMQARRYVRAEDMEKE